MTPYERALLEQIAFLETELERYRAEQERAAQPLPTGADPPIAWALRDPKFLQWRLLKQQIEGSPRR